MSRSAAKRKGLRSHQPAICHSGRAGGQGGTVVGGQPIEAARAFGKEDILDLLGIPVGYTRLKCALLGLKALKLGVYEASGETWDPDDE